MANEKKNRDDRESASESERKKSPTSVKKVLRRKLAVSEATKYMRVVSLLPGSSHRPNWRRCLFLYACMCIHARLSACVYAASTVNILQTAYAETANYWPTQLKLNEQIN